jgi:hypothetical protein
VHRADRTTDPTSSLDPPARAEGARSRPFGRVGAGRPITSHPEAGVLIASRDVLGSRCGMLAGSRERLEFLG